MSVTDTIALAPRRPLMIAALLLAGEFLLIGLVFKHGNDFHCRSNWPHLA